MIIYIYIYIYIYIFINYNTEKNDTLYKRNKTKRLYLIKMKIRNYFKTKVNTAWENTFYKKINNV